MLRQRQKKPERSQLDLIALGWGVSWLLGGFLFIVANTAFSELFSAVLVIFAVLLASIIGSLTKLKQYDAPMKKTIY